MGTGTYTENHHHRNHKTLYHHRNGNPAASSSSANKTFLPILCRVSVKDTIAHRPRTLCPKKDDPSSPRVSCMGQVKHHHLTPSSTASTVKPHHKIVPGRSRNSSAKCNQPILIDQRRRRQLCTKFGDHDKNVRDNNSCAAVVPVLNLAELDPPLPVIKRVPQACDSEAVSLWKRRSRGDGLANIQIPTFQCAYSIRTSAQP
ncbi:hypothetical protein DCAR_0416657 [Daucus carota subsp. sativus]|uniref:Uncharacterized protein n=1 Tax=Daucus carota subsp. sativus TaxID=79200 RepID=A0A165XNX6_DAUCS|nr:PREDICTED: uncharacterized protein LOC108217802 [Daucus carota subsp. sativus]WOG97317.1 hypothetical protein DCAR_0416657 [Daucus carota subsp. sativus]